MITNMIMRAISFATIKHDGQRRKVDKEPFIAHPYRVAMLLKDHDCQNDIVIAGLLHDVVEDTEGTLKEINELFGSNVANLVETVTEQTENATWKERKKESIEKLSQGSIGAKLIVCADKIDNLHSIIDNEVFYSSNMWHEFEGGKADQQWYYKSMYQSVTDGIDPDHLHPLMILYKSLLDQFLAH